MPTVKRFLTGDGLPDFKQKYPIWRKQNGVSYISAKRLCELYLKNNRYIGGDEIEAIDATPTMLKIEITFKDDEFKG